MSFLSTRGNAGVTASQAILYGAAPGEGLYVPAMFPLITFDFLNQNVFSKPYAQAAASLLSLFLDDYTPKEVLSACQRAYGEEETPSSDLFPLRPLTNNAAILELFHGPTASCKDVSMQLLPHLLLLGAQKNNIQQKIIAPIITTGDTGASAFSAFSATPGLYCNAFYPNNNANLVPQFQMNHLKGQKENLRAIGVKGSFPQLYQALAGLLAEPAISNQLLEKGFFLTSANSVNIGRLLAQIVTYFIAYGQLLATGQIAWGDPVHFVVPVGNFGNILAGFYARNMGLPIGKLLCASNRNNALTSFFKNGIYSTNRLFFNTLSPAMDVAFPANLERLLYEITDRDGFLVNQWMNLLKRTGSFSIGEQRMEWLSGLFVADYCNDVHIKTEIKHMYQRYGYLLDPHSAVASYVLYRYREKTADETPAIILSTASPFKFPQEVLFALEPDQPMAQTPLAALDRLKAYAPYPSFVPPLIESWTSGGPEHQEEIALEEMGEAFLSPGFETNPFHPL